MSFTWEGPPPPPSPRRGGIGVARSIFRGVPLALVVFGGLAVLLVLRLVEAPIYGARRPWTPYITQGVCRAALGLLGIRRRVHGTPVVGAAMVANHSSWLDIFTLNSAARIYFVAKAEVARWPGIGWLARATGTVFVRRARADAARQRTLIARRLDAGHGLLFFPEGTSTDGRRVLDFKPTLFAAFADRGQGQVQPISVVYTAPDGEDPRFYNWWGEMEFAGHLLSLLAAPGGGQVDITFHGALDISDYPDRKALAKAAETAVRAGCLKSD